MMNDYTSLSNRAGYNKSLAHFRLVSAILPQLTNGENLADLIDDLEKTKQVEKAQIGPLLNALIVERMAYRTLSFNMPTDAQSFQGIIDETEKWNRFDIIIAYHHPQLGITLINPKKPNQWESVQDLSRQELMVVYLRGMRDEDRSLEKDAVESLQNLLIGRPAGETAKFHDPNLKPKPAPAPAPAAAAPKPAAAPAATSAPAAAAAAAAPQPAAPQQKAAAQKAAPEGKAPPKGKAADSGRKRMTPKYAVQVTNELFHNGNVEAWKNIVESYKAKFTELEVHVYHDGEKVNDLNSLFKGGKVKNGDVLLFSVSGEEIKGVAKLQRYLFEGASLRYETFLKKDVNKVLTLF